MIILIPAYEPDHQLTALVRQLREADPWLIIVVVDDGSGPDYKDTFDDAARLGCQVLSYAVNGGKGHALKSGFAFIAERFPGHDVVCADSDGQHGVADIIAVADRVRHVTAAMVLGCRNFTENVPARSRFGNTVTRGLFRLATGQRITDTQTGLRGYRADMIPWLLTVHGQRYEYELNLLLEAKQAGYGIESVEIATVYLDHNSGSHFRPVADSIRIYAPLLKFLGSSVSAFAVDMVMFLLLSAVTDSLLLAVVGARLVSATVNFMINRRLVFEHGKDTSLRAAATGYAALVLVLLSANYAAMWTLTSLAIPDLLAKLVTELTLLGISYAVQQRFLFVRKARATPTEATAVETHIPALVPAQFQHSLAGKSGDQSPKRFRSN
ncbi:bifunctional glycosyltransferase family 2/GtrA family protein [Paenarthrobacter aurescens]|uniref:Glycosyl transferase n=1 Tax=Paenarthrobacter aurescens TaxID=43663 RepID=A0A4Y3NAX3_PAEAU|nr:bifunctional glycosyltransferase family 2/GtrA family protein [Paenarthrobacter aurescens]MDO6144794.1 bifunctional glycosyltransferase family 2/GtrA family protein [Paenarthrobacter aurescens]MDO6148639.1 bifunctional glycosyltransferase family 2/GtrA family protein [Paenarthrobacter aurescens]MDO6159885.1 bifunctional glycosyltransferase family 2/GtrA family protein [Paenarthrobacter aurescens]MDO6163744.1 bifunctional glycosyltransferase family 2/GtrA family protein [Paenarthrobacter aure